MNLMLFGAHMNILFIIIVKMFTKWLYRFPPSHSNY